MCTAIALAKKSRESGVELQITMIERDTPPPSGDPNQAFFRWDRRGAAQFKHPHAFLGLMCSILEDNYPDLLQEFFAAGARRVNFADTVPPHMMRQYRQEPGDEKLWVLMCRRATMETVLRRYVERTPGITIRNDTFVTGIRMTAEGDHSVAPTMTVWS